MIDHLAGAEGSVLAGGSPTSFTNPDLGANISFALFSSTPAAGMLQQPMSWDTLGGTLPGQPGSQLVPPQLTSREGFQRLPVTFDFTTAVFARSGGFTVGTGFTASDDTITGLFSGASGIGGPGQSFMAQPLPISSVPRPNLVGRKVGLAAVGVQFDMATMNASLTEFANALTLNLQP